MNISELELLNHNGKPLYRVVDRLPDNDRYPVLLGIDPVRWGWGDELAACQATGSGRYIDPLRCADMDAYESKPVCRRLAYHDGPHAYAIYLDGEPVRVDTFDDCECAEDFQSPCWHTPAGIERSNPDLVIYLEREAQR